MPAIIGALLAALSRLIASRGGAWLLSSLAFAGLTFGTQSFAVDPLLDQIVTYANATGEDAIKWLRFFNFDKAITIIVSAVSVKYGLQAGRAFLKKA